MKMFPSKYLGVLLLLAAFLQGYSLIANEHAEAAFGALVTLGTPNDADREKHWGEYHRRAKFIREHTPPDSLIILPPQSSNLSRIGNSGLTDYFVYPRRMAHVGSPRIDEHEGPIFGVVTPEFDPVDRVGTGDTSRGPRLVLDDSFAIVAVFPRTAPPETLPRDLYDLAPTPGSVAVSVGKLVLVFLAGAWPVLALFPATTPIGLAAGAMLAGGVLATLVALGLGFIGIRGSDPLLIAIFGMFALGGAITLRRRWLARRIGSDDRKTAVLTGIRVQAPHSAATYGAWLLVLGCFAVLLVASVSVPILSWDGSAIWGIKARALLSFESLRWLANGALGRSIRLSSQSCWFFWGTAARI